MLRSLPLRSRRPYLIVFTGLALCFTITFLYFRSSPFQTFQGWLLDYEFYDWDTRSAFKTVDIDQARDASIAELCRSFPTHLLEDIQPVLKTGYAVLHDRLPSQLQSVSACLDNIIIFSDLNEVFEGHNVIDVIAEIPSALRERRRGREQLASYDTLQASAANGTLAALNTTELKGWKTDKFKFLPAISRAWKRHPQRKWYVFYEDDTYILWDNLFRLLEHFNPDTPLYFGSPSPGCHPKPDVNVWFANGGPGFVLSREAMRRLTKDDWAPWSGSYLGSKLQEQFWGSTLDDCCGDSLLGCVLWHKKVTLSGLWPMFDVHKPHRVPFTEKIWCQPAMSMHHPFPEDLRGLWRWEWEYRQIDRPLLWRDMAVSYWNFANLTTRDDWDNSGRSSFEAQKRSEFYSHNPHESFEACRSACEALPKCLQFTYHRRKCMIDRSLRYGEHKKPMVERFGGIMNEDTQGRNPDDLRFFAGWVPDKVRAWIDDHPCDTVEWVRPSLERIF